ncbi:mucin-5AC-like [Perca fluviatilis]|uniref:mucin-5AC-like n=1 Tax=Perca fluviatilis TaxID=8168 RepID=UPI0019642955|nr:mucin-5AC-like [Perca fluviatilis]
MAISKNGFTIFSLLLTLTILETRNFIECSSPVLLVPYGEEHFLPHTREKRSALLAPVEYEVDVELNVTNIETVDYLRSLLDNGAFTLALGPTVNVTDIHITTVCYPNGTSFQCRCEDQYVWSHSNCLTYGACDEITDETCGCINSIPTNGQYCQPKKVLPVVYEYQISIEVNTTDIDQLRKSLTIITFPVQISSQMTILDANITTVCSQDETGFQCRCEDDNLWPCDKCATYGECDGSTNNTCQCIKAIPRDGMYCQSIHHQNFSVCPRTTISPSTAPPVLYEYIISVELNTTDVTLINQLRTILREISYPFSINNNIQISEANISTVCYPSSGGYQCLCEDQYRWPCDQCFLYGSCDNITDDTCGCINAIPPDGQYCQPADQYNFTACPVTTPSPPPTTPSVLYEYIISVELNTTDVTVISQLRTILRRISYPFSINNHIQISEANISTVCYPSSGGYQCLCEDQYRWPCDQCFLYGSCDNITDDTCGCINAIPPDGQYCQPADQYTCPVTTPSPTPTTPPVLYEYIISVELNTTNVTLINQLRTILRSISYPFSINNHIQISQANISTVCYPSSGGYQCLCEDQYRWPCDQCFLYGSCDNITDDTCGCINAIPPDGQYCQPADQYNFTACPVTTPSPTPTTPPVLYEYIISVELNTTNVPLINQLRTILRRISYPFSINNHIQISEANISTVCYPSSGGYQCLCEDQYRWPCDHCFLYGSCDNITDDTCGCINAIPPDGQYCQPADQYNFTACPVTTPSPPPTTPPVLYEYIISVELNTTNVPLINQLRTILRRISYPFSINNHIQISEANISTVCYPSSGGYQCLCEDQYRWPCDQCFLYGSCDNITDDTCGCINAIPPDGQYCQPADQYNFTACPVTTPSPTPTTPPVLYEYIISVEMNTTDVPLINQLRTILRSISYPFSINNHIQISEANISTVCYPSSGGYQCLCEDQYRWPCDHCFLYGSCDNITDDTCGCINAIPPDGQYCQPADQYNFTACPVTTPSPTPTTSAAPPVLYEYIISVEMNTTDVTLINQLRTILRSISYPFSINNHIQIYDINITTVCYPNGTTFQCRCEEQYRWPCYMCSTFGNCDDVIDNTCGCINAIPPDGAYCQPLPDLFICPSPNTPNDTTPVYTTTTPTTAVTNFTAFPVTTPSPPPTTPPVLYEYIISVEMNTTDVTLINQLRTILRSISYPFSIINHIQISEANISTVCYPSSGGYQCLCEDQYRWPCDQCFLYGSCDNIIDDTCGCINAIPPNGQYCQPADQYNFTACPVTTPSPPPTTPPVVYEYIISVELNTTDVTLINQLRTILRSISYPFSINNHIQISEANISTVCYPSSGGYQCLCEDQYRWPCDQCFLYGSCDNITDDTCGCINAIPPDGQYCRPADQYNLFICPSPTTPNDTTPVYTTTAPTTAVTNSTTVATTGENTTTVTTAPTTVTNSTPIATTHPNTTTPTMSSSAVTNSTTDTTAPTTVTNSTTVATTGVTTVTTTPTTVTNSTPIATTHPNTTTPTSSPTSAVTNSTTVTTAPTTVTNLTIIATTGVNTTTLTTTPTTVTNSTAIATTHPNTTTPTMSPTSAVTNSTTVTTAPTTVTNSTPIATTHPNTTTPTSSPTSAVTNSTTVTTAPTTVTNLTIIATTGVNTTTLTTTPTTVTNSTPIATTHPNTTTPTMSPTSAVTNSTTVTTAPTTVTNLTIIATTGVNTTTLTTTPTTVTNSTAIATTHPNTTTPTMSPTSAVTNSTTVTTAPTTVTNSTPIATTHPNTTTPTSSPTSAVTNSTTVTTAPTTVTNSTPIATTHPNTTTPISSPISAVTNSTTVTTAPTTVTNSTIVSTTGVNTTTVTTAPTTVTNSTPIATTHPNTTTPTMSPTSAVTNSTTVTTAPTTVTNSTPIATTHPNTTTPTSSPTSADTNSTTVTTAPTTVTNSTPIAATHPNTTTPISLPISAVTNSTTVTTAPTTVTNSTPIATTHPNTTTPTSSPTSAVINSTIVSTTGVNTTTVTTAPTTVTNSTTVTTAPTTVTNSTPIATTHPNTTTPTSSPTSADTNSTTVTTAPTTVTNSTPIATTHPNTTTPTSSPTSAVTNSTTVSTTGVNTTTVTTAPTTVTNSTPIATTHPNTTTPTMSPTSAVTNSTTVTTAPTTVTNSTPIATTHPNTTTPTSSPTSADTNSTTVTTAPTTVTNSTPIATTHPNTTTPTMSPTSAVTNSTTVTTAPTTVTNSTPIATTHPNTTTPTSSPISAVTNSTTVTTAPTTVTNSTPIATTHPNTTTPTSSPTSAVTNSTTVSTTGVNTTTVTTAPTTVTNSTPIATTHPNTTTPTMSSTSAVTNSTTVTTAPTTVTNSTPIATTHPNTTTPTSSPTSADTNSTTVTTAPTTVTNSTTVTTAPTTVTNSTPIATTHPNTTTPTSSPTSAVTSTFSKDGVAFHN